MCIMYATSKNGLRSYISVAKPPLQLSINNYGNVEASDYFKKMYYILIRAPCLHAKKNFSNRLCVRHILDICEVIHPHGWLLKENAYIQNLRVKRQKVNTSYISHIGTTIL